MPCQVLSDERGTVGQLIGVAARETHPGRHCLLAEQVAEDSRLGSIRDCLENEQIGRAIRKHANPLAVKLAQGICGHAVIARVFGAIVKYRSVRTHACSKQGARRTGIVDQEFVSRPRRE